MKDIQKIKEFFSKPLNEADFKKGDKITYLGHPGVIKAVNKEMTGDITYTVSYDKGTGKTTASNISNKGGEIKMAEAITTAYEAKEEYFKPLIRKDKSNPNFLYVDITYPAGSNVLSVGGDKTMGGQDREAGAAKALSMGNMIAKKLQSKYNIEDIDVSDLKNGKVEVFAVSDDFIKMASPSLDGSENKSTIPTKMSYYPSALYKEGEEETAVDMAKKQLDALGVKYELSGNEFRPFKAIYKPTNKPDRWYDEFEDIIHLFNLGSAVKQSMDESLTAGYPHRKTSGEGFEKIVIVEPIDDATKNKMIRNFRAEGWDAKPNNGGGITAVKKTSMNESNGFKSGKEFINIKLQKYPKAVAKINQLISMVGESNFTMEMAEWIFDFFNNASYESPVNEAKSEDKVDTITMDIPLFLRMLEYSREDASQDMDLHDVTEKANKLGKERGILSMEDYEEIVGAAEEIKEIEDDKFKNDPWKGGPEYKKEDLLAQKIFGIKYFGWLDSWEQSHLVNKYNLDKSIITKEGKEVNLKQSKLSSAEYQKAKKLKNFKASDWKWNADEDLYTKVNEGELTEAKSFTIDSYSASDSDKITDFLTQNNISFKKVGPKIKISLDRDTPKASVILSKLNKLAKFDELNEGKLAEAYYQAVADLGIKKTKENLDTFEEVQEFLNRMEKRNAISVDITKFNQEGKSQTIKYNWDGEQWVKISKSEIKEAELTEAYVPSNIKEFAKRKGVSSLVNKIAGWAEKVGKGIRGGTAIGYNYSTLILDMTYQGSEIRINTNNDTVTLYDEPVYSFNDFKQVYLDNQDESDNGLEERIAEALNKINEELCPAGKAYIKRRQAAGEKSSAYLSGRGVKVCKGQMSGKAKKKK